MSSFIAEKPDMPTGRFLPQPVEIEFRVRGVLGRVVPAYLVIRPPIRRPEVDVFEAVALDPERDSDEAASPGPCIGARFSCQFDLNSSIVKAAALQNRVRRAIRSIRQRVHANRRLPAIVSGFSFHIVQLQLVKSYSRDILARLGVQPENRR